MRRLALIVLVLVPLAVVAGEQARVPGRRFETVMPPAPGIKVVSVPAFRLDRVPVTNAQFAAFVAKHDAWRRDRVPSVFADERYLSHWRTSIAPTVGTERQPVTQVSWFAANAYCEARGARLPRWYEWELAAAASEHDLDARADPEWRQSILDWYSISAARPLADVGSESANVYGIHDLHGVVWEWIEDAAGILVSDDGRAEGDPDLSRFCGSGALSLEQKENYAMLMRIAMLSSMKAAYTSRAMGFRCATDGAAP